jgi:hypothetical protein
MSDPSTDVLLRVFLGLVIFILALPFIMALVSTADGLICAYHGGQPVLYLHDHLPPTDACESRAKWANSP